MEDWQINQEVIDIIKSNQMPDQNGFGHPNAGIFKEIEKELKRLSNLAKNNEMSNMSAG